MIKTFFLFILAAGVLVIAFHLYRRWKRWQRAQQIDAAADAWLKATEGQSGATWHSVGTNRPANKPFNVHIPANHTAASGSRTDTGQSMSRGGGYSVTKQHKLY